MCVSQVQDRNEVLEVELAQTTKTLRETEEEKKRLEVESAQVRMGFVAPPSPAICVCLPPHLPLPVSLCHSPTPSLLSLSGSAPLFSSVILPFISPSLFLCLSLCQPLLLSVSVSPSLSFSPALTLSPSFEEWQTIAVVPNMIDRTGCTQTGW